MCGGGYRSAGVFNKYLNVNGGIVHNWVYSILVQEKWNGTGNNRTIGAGRVGWLSLARFELKGVGGEVLNPPPPQSPAMSVLLIKEISFK